MRTFEEIKNTIETGLGRHACDLKIKNVNLVNVFSGEVYPTNIYIKNKRVVSIDPKAELKAERILDGKGQYALPGLIDTHMHFESTMLSPEALASVVVPQGTTTMCADLMEIANVAGEEGLRAMLQSMNRLPYRMLIEVSSRVPTAPGLETTGAVLGAEEVAKIMDWEESVSLGELDPSKILFVKDEYIHKVADTLSRRKLVNGHAIGRLGQELNVYASSGISDDHECVNTNEMLERLKVGMKVLIREGSSERNVDELVKGVIENHLDTSNLMHFRMEDEIGSITPGRLADIILVEDWHKVKPTVVIFEGEVVAENGELLTECKISDYPEWLKHTVDLKNPITAESFKTVSKIQQGATRVHVIDMIPRQIINNHIIEVMQVKDGEIQMNVEKDLLKLAVVERYGKNGNVGVAFVHGFKLKKGALAYSMSHDHHNIVVVGTNNADMALAVNEVARLNGGLAVACDGIILNGMELPIGGLMSEKSSEEVMAQLDMLNADARKLGCEMDAPFMSLSFISLPTVPELGLTDLGLVDVLAHKLIPLELEEEYNSLNEQI